MSVPAKLIFLPGASGRVDFWRPVGGRLVHQAPQVHLGWPGFGPTPADPAVGGIDDLVARVVAGIDGPTALVAQSMGGVVAIRAALACPEHVTHLVLTATSGGIDVAALGACDWRPSFLAENPALPDWFARPVPDLTAALAAVSVPVLLLWGDADPISPVAVGLRLRELLPDAVLHVVPGGDHDLAMTHSAAIAPLIDQHIMKYYIDE